MGQVFLKVHNFFNVNQWLILFVKICNLREFLLEFRSINKITVDFWRVQSLEKLNVYHYTIFKKLIFSTWFWMRNQGSHFFNFLVLNGFLLLYHLEILNACSVNLFSLNSEPAINSFFCFLFWQNDWFYIFLHSRTDQWIMDRNKNHRQHINVLYSFEPILKNSLLKFWNVWKLNKKRQVSEVNLEILIRDVVVKQILIKVARL